MSGHRFLFLARAVNDPGVIAAKAQALLDKGQRVDVLGPNLWRCTPNEAGYCRAAVFYALPGQPLPAGWQRGAQWGCLRLVYTTDADAPPPAVTDREQNEVLVRFLRSLLPRLAVTLLLVALLLGSQLQLFRQDLPATLSDSAAVGMTLLALGCLVYLAVLLGSCLVRLTGVRRALARQEPPPPPQRRCLLLTLAVWAWLLGSLALILPANPLAAVMLGAMLLASLALLPLRIHLQAKGRSPLFIRLVNTLVLLAVCLVTLVAGVAAVLDGRLLPRGQTRPVAQYREGEYLRDVYDDPLPLTVEALTGSETGLWSKRRTVQWSPLLCCTSCSQNALGEDAGILEDLEYQIMDSPLPPVQQGVLDALLGDHRDEVQPDGTVFRDSYQPADPTLWGAVAVYQRHWSQTVLDDYLVVWPGRIVAITFYWTPTDDQLAAAAAALRPQ